MYGLPNPSQCLEKQAPTKSEFKDLYNTRVSVFHEKELRSKSANNIRMRYLNISILGLNNKPHPAICGVFVSKDVEKMRLHVKFLCQDYLTYETQSEWSGCDPTCRLCRYTTSDPQDNTQSDKRSVDTIAHIVATCPALSDIRDQILKQIEALTNSCVSNLNFTDYLKDEQTLTHYLLDPSSMNLQTRVHVNDPVLPELFKLSRDLCYQLDKKRRAKLNSLAAKT